MLHPGLVLIVGALALPWLRGHLRTAAVLLLPLLALALVWQVPDGAWQLRFLDYTFTPLQRRQAVAPVRGHLRVDGRSEADWFALGRRAASRCRPLSSTPGRPSA